MSTFVDCPMCGRQLRVTDDLTGGRLRCPACDSAFDAPSADPGVNGDAAADEEAKPKPGTPWSVTPNARPAAPAAPAPELSAGGDEPAEEEGDEDERPWEQPYRDVEVRRDCEPHRGNLILILGILSLVVPLPIVGLVLGIMAIVMGRADLKKMDSGAMDPQGKGSTLAGWICGIIGTIFQALGNLYILFIVVVWVIVAFALMQSIRTMPPPGPPPVMPPPAPKVGRLDVLGGAPLALRGYLPRARGCLPLGSPWC